MQSNASQLSSYFEGLDEKAKARYKENFALIDGNDPFGKVVGGETFDGVVSACGRVRLGILSRASG